MRHALREGSGKGAKKNEKGAKKGVKKDQSLSKLNGKAQQNGKARILKAGSGVRAPGKAQESSDSASASSSDANTDDEMQVDEFEIGESEKAESMDLDQDEFNEQAKALFSDDEQSDSDSESQDADSDEDSNASHQAVGQKKIRLSARQSKALDRQEAREKAEAQMELLRTNVVQPDDVQTSIDYLFPDQESLDADPRAVYSRIQELVRILSDFKTLAQKNKSRADYMDRFIEEICTYYGYNQFLAEKLTALFTVAEALAFFEANETPRPVTIRTNTLRTSRRDLVQVLSKRGVNLQPVGKWSKTGLQVFDSQVPIGATPEYLAGHYILQSPSSFLPVLALAPEMNERILDMASAPGGKVTYLSALMQNTGQIIANDSDTTKTRMKALAANIHRLGCKNIIICNYDAREFPKVMGGFDRVMLDAPCSGTGVIAKDMSVKSNKSERDLALLSQLQKQLILCAIDSVNPTSKTGGYVVYSSCSVMTEENEAVVDYALRKRPNVRLVPTGLDFGVDGFTSFAGKNWHHSLKHTKRIYPHVHNLDGFFVAKLKIEKRQKQVEVGQTTKPEPEVTFNDAEDDQLIKKSLEIGKKKARKP